MEKQERKVYLETRLRNLKRKYSRLIQHPDLIEETRETKQEINTTIKELEDAMI